MAASPCSTKPTAANTATRQGEALSPPFDIPPPALERREFDSHDRRYAGIAIPPKPKDTKARVLPMGGADAPGSQAAACSSPPTQSLRHCQASLHSPRRDRRGKPTGQPIVYELDDSLAAVERYFLKDR